MRQIEWAIWANEQALLSATGIFIGAIIGVAGQFINWEFAAFMIPASILLLLLEYPRSKRMKGHTIQRRYQQLLSPVMVKCSPVTTNYYGRFIIHIVLSVPCCFLLPTLMGGMCLMLAAIIYFVAALKGEEWHMMESVKDSSVPTIATSQPPNRPPPRAPARRHVEEDNELYVNTGGLNKI